MVSPTACPRSCVSRFHRPFHGPVSLGYLPHLYRQGRRLLSPIFCERGMVNHLHRHPGRIEAVKAARPVAMGTRRGLHRHALRQQERMPGIDISGRREYEADVVQPLRPGRHHPGRPPVQREDVVDGGEINVVRVRPPLDPHAEQRTVKALAGSEILDEQRRMAQAGGGCGSLHQAVLRQGSGGRHYKEIFRHYQRDQPAGSTISKSWLISTPARPSMMEAEQYFSAERFTARFTAPSANPRPVTMKWT